MSETKIPASAKKPQDHKAPKAEADSADVTLTVRGVEVTVAADARDDFEVLDDLGEIDSGNPTRLPGLLKRLVGRERYRDLLEAARDEKTGRVSIETGAELVKEILDQLDPNS